MTFLEHNHRHGHLHSKPQISMIRGFRGDVVQMVCRIIPLRLGGRLVQNWQEECNYELH